MNPETPQVPTQDQQAIELANSPEQMLIQYLQDLDDRLKAVEDKVGMNAQPQAQ